MSMGTWQRCLVCQETGFSGTHRCKPEWEACDPSDWQNTSDREWETVRAADAEHAAEVYCARRDPYNEYGIVSSSRTVLVRPIGRDDQLRYYEVYGELQPTYTAHLRQPIGDD